MAAALTHVALNGSRYDLYVNNREITFSSPAVKNALVTTPVDSSRYALLTEPTYLNLSYTILYAHQVRFYGQGLTVPLVVVVLVADQVRRARGLRVQPHAVFQPSESGTPLRCLPPTPWTTAYCNGQRSAEFANMACVPFIVPSNSQELLDNVESLCALDRPAGGASANLSGGLLDTRAYRIKRSQLQARFIPTALQLIIVFVTH